MVDARGVQTFEESLQHARHLMLTREMYDSAVVVLPVQLHSIRHPLAHDHDGDDERRHCQREHLHGGYDGGYYQAWTHC